MKLISNMATDSLSLMVCDARGANFKSRGRVYATRDAILKSGPQLRDATLGPRAPRLNFFNYVSPRAGLAKYLMHSRGMHKNTSEELKLIIDSESKK